MNLTPPTAQPRLNKTRHNSNQTTSFMENDPEYQLQADNGRNVGPFGLLILAVCVVPCIVASWNWAKILAWFSIVTLVLCGIGFGILATR